MGPLEIGRAHEVGVVVVLTVLGLSLVTGYLLAHGLFRGEEIKECEGMKDEGS